MPWPCQEPCMMPEGQGGQAVGTPRLVLAFPPAVAQQMLWGDLLAHAASCRAPTWQLCPCPLLLTGRRVVPMGRDGAGLRDGLGMGWQGDSQGMRERTRRQRGG